MSVVSVACRPDASEASVRSRQNYCCFPFFLKFCARIDKVRIVAIAASGQDSHEFGPGLVLMVDAGPVS